MTGQATDVVIDDPRESAKRAAARAAARLVADGMTVGLGTGSTARWFIKALGEMVAAGAWLRGVATSEASATLAVQCGIEVIVLGDEPLDIAVDGADQVDPGLRLIKGAGGAMVRERIVAAAAQRFIVVVDSSKIVGALSGRVPVEVLPFGWQATVRALRAFGDPRARGGDAEGAPARSDNGNYLVDLDVGGVIADPDGLASALDAVPGVVGHGLFIGMAEHALVALPDGSVETVLPV